MSATSAHPRTDQLQQPSHRMPPSRAITDELKRLFPQSSHYLADPGLPSIRFNDEMPEAMRAAVFAY